MSRGLGDVYKRQLKDDACTAIEELKALNINNIQILSGDKQAIVTNFAEKLGVARAYGNLLPNGKVEHIEELKRNTANRIAFVGDGINDAPVLSASDCGIAMGFGSEAAIEASDAVLASGTLKQLPKAIKIARSVINTVKGNIIFALSIKALVIILAAFGLAQIWMSVIADTGVSVVCVIIAARLLKKKY